MNWTSLYFSHIHKRMPRVVQGNRWLWIVRYTYSRWHCKLTLKFFFSLTYDHTNGFCGLYLDCASIGTEQCEQCITGKEKLRKKSWKLNQFIQGIFFTITGPVTCEYIQCNIPGQCVGIFEYQQTAQTQTDCEASSMKALIWPPPVVQSGYRVDVAHETEGN